jgi:hypothetical protein
MSLPDCATMLGPLAIPPRLLARALDDLHTVAGRLGELVESVSVLPRTEDELSANIVLLRPRCSGAERVVAAASGLSRAAAQ